MEIDAKINLSTDFLSFLKLETNFNYASKHNITSQIEWLRGLTGNKRFP